MNIDDPFADDLKSLDAVMAQFAASQDRQSHAPSGGMPSAAAASSGFPPTEMVGRQGRRGELLPPPPPSSSSSLPPSGLGRQQPPYAKVGGEGRRRAVEATKPSEGEPLPWEVDDDTRELSKVEPTHASEASLGALPSSFRRAGNRRDTAPAVGDDDKDNDDPLAFLESPAVARAPAAVHSAAPSLLCAEDGEVERRGEQRELLSSLDAVEMELEQLQGLLDTLQIKAEKELTELETTVIRKQTELASCEDSFTAERRTYEAYHQRRMQAVHDNTPSLLQQQGEEVSAAAKDICEAQLRSIRVEVQDVQSRIDQLLEQRELLQQHHRFSEKGILLSLRMEENEDGKKKATEGTTGGGGGGGGVSAKMDAALRILRQHQNEQLNSLANCVLRFLHQETANVACEVRERHEVAYVEDAVRRKEALGDFMHDLLLRYREFFRHRAEQKMRNTAALREGLQVATAQLREHARQRLETRMQEAAAKTEEAARRFQKHVAESVDCAQRKAAAVQEGDEGVAKREREDLVHRFHVEQTVLKNLQQSEVEMLQQQLERLKRLGDDDGEGGTLKQLREETQVACVTKVESCTSAVRALESEVQQLLQRQLARNRALGVEVDAVHLHLTDDELVVRMTAQEREAVFASLLDEVQRRQGELFAARRSTGELREQITSRLQEEVQYVRQQRAEQESHLASLELVRMAWEREQREMLQWGYDVLPQQQAHSSSRTHLPAATAMMGALCLVSERNQALVASRKKIRMQRSQLQHALQKEHDGLAAGWQAVEARWAQMLEQLLELMAQQEKLAARQLSGVREMAKVEATREMLQHDTALFRRKYDELKVEAQRLKEELQEALEHKAKHVVLHQKLMEEQIALAKKQHRLALEDCRTENNAVVFDAAPHTLSSEAQHTTSSLVDKRAASRSTTDGLQEEASGENPPESMELQQRWRRRRRRSAGTVSPGRTA